MTGSGGPEVDLRKAPAGRAWRRAISAWRRRRPEAPSLVPWRSWRRRRRSGLGRRTSHPLALARTPSPPRPVTSSQNRRSPSLAAAPLPTSQKYSSGLLALAYGVLKRANDIVDDLRLAQIDDIGAHEGHGVGKKKGQHRRSQRTWQRVRERVIPLFSTSDHPKRTKVRTSFRPSVFYQ